MKAMAEIRIKLKSWKVPDTVIEEDYPYREHPTEDLPYAVIDELCCEFRAEAFEKAGHIDKNTMERPYGDLYLK